MPKYFRICGSCSQVKSAPWYDWQHSQMEHAFPRQMSAHVEEPKLQHQHAQSTAKRGAIMMRFLGPFFFCEGMLALAFCTAELFCGRGHRPSFALQESRNVKSRTMSHAAASHASPCNCFSAVLAGNSLHLLRGDFAAMVSNQVHYVRSGPFGFRGGWAWVWPWVALVLEKQHPTPELAQKTHQRTPGRSRTRKSRKTKWKLFAKLKLFSSS